MDLHDDGHLAVTPALASTGSPRFSRPRRSRRTRVAAGTTVATLFLLGGGGIAAAAPSGGFAGRGGGPGVVGTLKSVKGSTLTVKTTAGKTETAKVTSSTTYEKTSTGTISLLKAGDQVTAIGTLSNGALDASRVMIGTAGFFGGGRPGGGAPGGGEGGPGGGTPPTGAGGTNPTAPTGRAGFTFVTGTVSDITATSFVLTETSGTKGTVNVASTTTFTETTKIAESALKVGQTVTIRGKAASSGTVTASAVVEGKVTAFGFGGGGRRPPAA